MSNTEALYARIRDIDEALAAIKRQVIMIENDRKTLLAKIASIEESERATKRRV